MKKLPPDLIKSISYVTSVPAALYHVTNGHDVSKVLRGVVGEVLNIVLMKDEEDLKILSKVKDLNLNPI